MNWSNNWGNQAQSVQPKAKLDEAIPPEYIKLLKEADLPETPDGLLMLWQASKEALTKAKNFEMDIRKLAVKVYVPNPQEGMNNVDLGNGYTLKAGVKFNYKLKDNDTVDKVLQEIARTGNEGAFIADRLISWTPTFLLTEYRKLQEDADNNNETAKTILKLIDGMLTIEDAAPTLDIKEPKAKK